MKAPGPGQERTKVRCRRRKEGNEERKGAEEDDSFTLFQPQPLEASRGAIAARIQDAAPIAQSTQRRTQRVAVRRRRNACSVFTAAAAAAAAAQLEGNGHPAEAACVSR